MSAMTGIAGYKHLLFTLLQITHGVWSFEVVTNAVNRADTGRCQVGRATLIGILHRVMVDTHRALQFYQKSFSFNER